MYTHADIDECATDPCDENAHCNNTEGSYVCVCNDGYTGDGLLCHGKSHKDLATVPIKKYSIILVALGVYSLKIIIFFLPWTVLFKMLVIH